MVNVGVMMKLATAPQLPPPMLYLPVSNLTGFLLRPDGCIHNANAQQLCKHITLDCNQYRRLDFCVWVLGSYQGLRLNAFMMLIRAV